MLCQLVCLDRRYQRMNCFNIREVESLLKSRFFPDLVNSYDYRLLLNNTIINLRYKTTTLTPLDNNLLLFNHFNLEKAVHAKTLTSNTVDYLSLNSSAPFLTQLYFLFTKSYCFSRVLYLNFQLLAVGPCTPTTVPDVIERFGFYAILDLFSFFSQYCATELSRQMTALLYLTNLSKDSKELTR